MTRTKRRDNSKKFGVDKLTVHIERTHGVRFDKAKEIALGIMEKFERELLEGNTVMLKGVMSMKLVVYKAKKIGGMRVGMLPARMGLKTRASEGLLEKANKNMRRSGGSADPFHLARSIE